MDGSPPASDGLETVLANSVFRPVTSRPDWVDADPASRPAPTDVTGWLDRLVSLGFKTHRVASPDLIGQIEQSARSRVDTLICSVLDTDPSVPFNATVAETFTTEMAAGVDLLGKLTGAGRVWITADPEKSSDWFSTVSSRIEHPGLRLVPLRGDYPQTDPTLMLFTLLQRRLLPGRLPTEKGALLLDAAAAVALGRCVLYAPPINFSELAVRDHFERKTHYLTVPIGISLAEVCDFLEIGNPDAMFRAGDFLRDQWITRQALLGQGELVIHPTARHLEANPDPCIHCGWCLEACPTRIHPAGLLDAAQQANLQLGRKYGIEACIECGICSYVCPTRLPLLSAIRSLKQLSD